jgi:homoserine dehydrogenase
VVSEEVSVGLLGLGNVGGGVVRTLHTAEETLHARGVRIRISAALVRDARRPRPASACVGFVTDSVPAFFSRPYDVVVELLGNLEPAVQLVEQVLDSGTPVVTANKSLLAAHGASLVSRARARGTELRFEASVVAGLPFLDMLGRRPLAGAIDGVEAILNGTSNFILTAMAEEGIAFSDALARAIALGYAEPQPESDVSGRDAAEKLCVLLRHLGVGDLQPCRIRTASIVTVTPEDVADARRRGGAIKPVVRASRSEDGVVTFVGPEFVGPDHPLSHVNGPLNGVLLHSRFAGPLFYSGPGAGPDVTAATILDDIVTLAESGAFGTSHACPPSLEERRRVASTWSAACV